MENAATMLMSLFALILSGAHVFASAKQINQTTIYDEKEVDFRFFAVALIRNAI